MQINNALLNSIQSNTATSGFLSVDKNSLSSAKVEGTKNYAVAWLKSMTSSEGRMQNLSTKQAFLTALESEFPSMLRAGRDRIEAAIGMNSSRPLDIDTAKRLIAQGLDPKAKTESEIKAAHKNLAKDYCGLTQSTMDGNAGAQCMDAIEIAAKRTGLTAILDTVSREVQKRNGVTGEELIGHASMGNMLAILTGLPSKSEMTKISNALTKELGLIHAESKHRNADNKMGAAEFGSRVDDFVASKLEKKFQEISDKITDVIKKDGLGEAGMKKIENILDRYSGKFLQPKEQVWVDDFQVDRNFYK